ncbi:T3SS (YopN, CesT) and YbjN peptide-binding chaperone 1 [Mycobacterium bourgelatii]|uniref:TY-Chap central domain-containing protein n=1 Tax=Mycobacterium bourgelatii TaxID=1273442 RepID=A0A7I9YS15_MYCBU|nr:YbjN domain-containing protein [Mycobacterium bourgelatii]MCV6978595.1 hypothetical protein [Mycobacterium bourgelatii]GFG91415.1 hypothetical protein MBOU_34570 [Mycobacterium bourgelatii]
MKYKHVHRQILAILETNGLSWAETSIGELHLRFSSVAITIQLVDWGAQTLIHISSHVLTGVTAGTKRILIELNDLNARSHFGRWVYYKDSRAIAIEYDLLGDHLQENELMTALAAVARLADYHDDALQQEFGGARAFEG